ncbi:FIST C-terminal domain-containing protein [Flavobacteriaceae bacterium F89]|uniref:FIST C-terminal domain-containing protein n=1 Tax=Cerina litoralis TaxID=2874477 RepID=A0AAE3ETE8_9FLAO|nr:FIST N-terminal domain-containing protein [Cerina litoralis]MCG2459247.1 FIST C-terminal domain-containing protein [Cerina litoralis]
MQAKTIKANSNKAITKEIDKAISDGFKPTLAIVFASVKQDWKAVSDMLNKKEIVIFGATTAGEFIDGNIEEGSIVMMLLNINPNYFKLEFLETSTKTTLETAKKLGAIAKKAFPNPALIIATGGIFIDGEQIVDGIMQGFGEEATVFGGMAGDDLIAEKPIVFTNKKSKDNALLALIIDEDKIDVRGLATCGWNAIGTTKTVTKSDGNIVYTIDDKPALDMLMKYLGVDVKIDEDKEIVPFLNSWYYPLQLERDNGDTVIRATRFANSKERSLICTGSVPQGSKIKFSLPPEFDAIETVVSECASIKDNAQQRADALIMFSCVSRHLSFGALMSEEIEQVQNVWNAPMVGFFTYGEYGKSKIGTNEFHNNACCVVALKEK